MVRINHDFTDKKTDFITQRTHQEAIHMIFVKTKFCMKNALDSSRKSQIRFPC